MQKLVKQLTQTWILVLIVVGLAACFRLPLMQYVEFKGDEALNLFLAARPLFHHPFPPAAQASSAGILNFPLLNFLLFPIVLLTLYPPTISFVIALLNVFTIGGFFLLFKRYHGKTTAFFTSCILALSPWAILYSRKIWAQDFLLPLSLPFFYSLYKIIEGKREYWFLFGLTSMLLMQLHQLGILLPFLLFLGLFIKKNKPLWKHLLAGILIGLIPTVPYFWYAFLMHFSIFQTTSSLTDRFSFHDIQTFIRPVQIISIGDFHTEMGDDFATFAQKFHLIYIFSKASYFAYFALPIGAIFFWFKNKIYRFFIPVICSIILLYFMLGIEPLMHYYILFLPLFALFLGDLANNVNKSLRTVFFAIMAIFLLSLFTFDFGFLMLLSQKGGFAGDYGSGFATSEQSAKLDLQKFKNDSDYAELQLFYFAPIEYFHGYMPVGKMIYPYSEMVKSEPTIEKQFMKSPSNPLLATQVFAYYTQNPDPSWKYIVMLKEKTRKYPAYNFIYQKLLNEYLDKHLKRLYETPDFMLLYPQHWSANKISDGIELTDGSVAVDVLKISAPNNSSVFLRANNYIFTPVILDANTQNPKLQKYLNETFSEIKKSVIPLF